MSAGMNGPSHASTYERARRLANLAVWTALLQRRRLSGHEPEDDDFLFRRWADFQFFIVALTRVRRAAALAAKIPIISNDIERGIQEFDAALPMLKNMRDVAEHFDDYALDRGRLKSVSRKGLEVGVVSDTIFQWLGYELNADVALKAAQRLFQRIKLAQASFPKPKRRHK
jgi:hypothetical protein